MDVLVTSDGAPLVADDYAAAIFHIHCLRRRINKRTPLQGAS